MFEHPHRMQAWCRLAKKKWMGADDGESNITREDFDALLGHSVAVTDAAASVFAAEMIAAYPEAKVVLNRRPDLDAWHQSAITNVAGIAKSWHVYLTSWCTSYGYWAWSVWERYLWRLLFRAEDGNVAHAIRRNGKWIYREHENMIRGLVPKENILEWSVDDGWEPLCKVNRTSILAILVANRTQFLGKPVPNEPFPATNNVAGFQQRVADFFALQQKRQNRKMIMASVLVGGLGLASWRLAPERMIDAAQWIQNIIRGIGK